MSTSRDDINAWLRNDDLFSEQLKIGHEWTKRLAKSFVEAGVEPGRIIVPESIMRSHVDERDQFQNETDIIIMTKSHQPVVIESKSRNLAFNSPSDYPYSTALVDTVTGWERKSPTPFAVVLTSQITGAHICIAPRTSKQNWKQVERTDRVRGIKDRFYECSKRDLLPFEALVNRINQPDDGSRQIHDEDIESNPIRIQGGP